MKNKILNTIKLLILTLLLLSITSLPIELFGINIDKFSQTGKVIYSLICDITLLSIIIFIYRKTLINDFKLFKKNLANNLEYSFKFWFIGVLIMIASNIFIIIFLPQSNAGNEEAVRALIDLAPLYMLFSVSIYAPITEELIFRKGIRDIINNKYIYIIVSGCVFGALHVVSSINSIYDLAYLVPYCSLGITFALLYYKSKNIFSSISMHFLHNTLTIVLYLLGSSLWEK